MSSKSLKILGILFLVLLIISIFPVVSKDIQSLFNKKKETSNLSLFPKILSTDSLSLIDIKNQEAGVTVKRYPEGWRVEGYPASLETIQKLTDALNEIQIGDAVSKNKSNHKQLGVDESNGLILTLNMDNNETKLVLGNYAVGGGFYLRKLDSDYVYLVKGGVRAYLIPSVSGWVDLNVLNLPKEQIAKIDFVSFNKISIAKNEGKWKVTKGKSVTDLSEDTANKLLDLFNPLKAEGILTAEQKTEFNKSKKISLEFFNNEDKVIKTLYFVDKGTDYWLQAKDLEEALYYLKKETLSNLSSL